MIFCLYLLKNYFKVLFLSVFSFIAILLVSRLEEIAQFAALGTKLSYIFLFILYQIPYILPIAIPISCLISTMILFQRLSHTHELTALRSCGIPLKKIISPILIAGFFLSLGTFYIASELATASHLATRKMVYDLSSVNPLLLLQSAKIARLQDAFVQLDPIRNGESAKDLIIAVNNVAQKRLNLCIIKHLEMAEQILLANQISLISTVPSEKNHSKDHLVIENQKYMSSSAPEFAKLLGKSGWRMANDHLKFSLLRIRVKALYEKAAQGQPVLRQLNKCQSEILRRISLGMATFTFTLMGIAFGMEISRNKTKKGVLSILILSVGCLVAFCIAKTYDHHFLLAALLLLFPHACTIFLSIRTLSRLNRGIE